MTTTPSTARAPQAQCEAVVQRRRPSRGAHGFPDEALSRHHHPLHKDECTPVKTCGRKPVRPPCNTLTQNSRPDSPSRSLSLPATARRLDFQQPMETEPTRRRRRASTITSTRTGQASTSHTYTTDRCSSSCPGKLIKWQRQRQQQQPLARDFGRPSLPDRRPRRPTSHP